MTPCSAKDFRPRSMIRTEESLFCVEGIRVVHSYPLRSIGAGYVQSKPSKNELESSVQTPSPILAVTAAYTCMYSCLPVCVYKRISSDMLTHSKCVHINTPLM